MTYAVEGRLLLVLHKSHDPQRLLDDKLVDRWILNRLQFFRIREAIPEIRAQRKFGDISDQLMLLNVKPNLINGDKSGVVIRVAHKHTESGAVMDFNISEFVHGFGECVERTVDGVRDLEDVKMIKFKTFDDPSSASISELEHNRTDGGSVKIDVGEIRTFFCKQTSLSQRDDLLPEISVY